MISTSCSNESAYATVRIYCTGSEIFSLAFCFNALLHCIIDVIFILFNDSDHSLHSVLTDSQISTSLR